ncbi:hypothetical protein CC85DRAFT_286353 [Cutaneotrichosporon oleaginosum]|uniref:Uncharacterized protein n=1 Tax=Cutaneotrichosporon oleaginosum TaxID=879819 RepID=A0A0J0XKD1_9TREE|nr:uncharacterized protein CC85DRAFT_286353 [Cutaneotrichosporon oleaginosum]KLT41578.1 hypothetical protein CC85DRAFT_286353 [Cutaneotrichosporon oleaginosum]TXT09344.1 hypothetical protein COLE_03278 [Cutaneotrichosporon oleaginosum]
MALGNQRVVCATCRASPTLWRITVILPASVLCISSDLRQPLRIDSSGIARTQRRSDM